MPANDCQNTFAVTLATEGVGYDLIAGNVAAFYNDVGASTFSVASFINDTILRPDGLLIEIVEDPANPPNPPAYAELFTLQASTSGTPLPQEVAVCVSFTSLNYYTTATPGRERGRVYVGPLNIAAGIDPGTNQVSRPNPNLVTTLHDNFNTMYTGLQTDGNPLAIWSRADDFFYVVGGGWIDNEFDTQRRRGHESTGRTPL